MCRPDLPGTRHLATYLSTKPVLRGPAATRAEVQWWLQRLQALVATLAVLRHDTEVAAQTLATFEDALRAMREHLALVERRTQPSLTGAASRHAPPASPSAPSNLPSPCVPAGAEIPRVLRTGGLLEESSHETLRLYSRQH